MRLLAVLSTLWIAADSLWFLVAITARRLAGLPNLYNQWQSFLINARALTTFALLTVLMTLLFREQRRNTVERAAFAAELEAARVVQQVLIPEEIPNVPGFRIESIYKPAGQVGGDFSRFFPTTKGGVLIVIGDVSGKGMPAAMTVSLLVGTIRTLAHYTQSPAEILAAMNQRMLGRSRGGFTTCLALHVTGDGELFAANAGHLAPYRNGEELPIESGLPLGLSAGSAYAVAKFRLDPGSRFTLLTDGVVEARKPSGELFGFERTAAIASNPPKGLSRRRRPLGRRMTSRSLPSRLQARGWRMRRATNVILYLLLFLVAVSGVVRAQNSAAMGADSVRYHFGDDPGGAKGWAKANLDDSSWPVAHQDKWPEPALYSDGFVWVRILVPVRSDTAEPLALRVGGLSHVLIADEVFINGMRVGSFGRVPPRPYVEGLPRDAIFDLQPGLARPGTVAHVVLRIWYPPFVRRAGQFDNVGLTFDQSRTLHVEGVVAGQRALLGHILPIIFNSLILLIGLAVLLLAFSVRSLDLYLYGAMLATLPWFPLFFGFVDAGLVTLSASQVFLFEVILQTPAMIITVEFIWRINRYSDVWFRGLAYASMALFNLALLAAFIPATPSALVSVGVVGNGITIQVFNFITIIANLWAIFIKRQRRLIAFAMLLVPVSAVGFHLGDTFQGEANLRGEDYFLLAFLGASLFSRPSLRIRPGRNGALGMP